jgi:hypothetical protein
MSALPRAYFVVLLASAVVVLVADVLLDVLVLVAGHNVSIWQGIAAPAVGVVAAVVAVRGLRCRPPSRFPAQKPG